MWMWNWVGTGNNKQVMYKVPEGFEIRTENGIQYYGSKLNNIFPIHSLSCEMKENLSKGTHHYCDVFTEKILAELPEKVYVNNTEYIVNKKKRILIVSYDGVLNLWQNAPTFKSPNHYISGTPILNSDGNIVSMVTGSQNGNYAISCFDGYSGRFKTKHNWTTVNSQKNIVYGNQTFDTREALSEYLKGRKFGDIVDLQAVVVKAKIPRIILFDLLSGIEVSHTYIRGDFDVEICEKYH